MKKTLVALAVAALAATSANAATVYNQDGTKLDIGGSVRFLLDKSTGNRANLGNDGSRVNFSAKQDLGNGLSALGYLRLKIDGDNASGLSVNKLYAGLAQKDVGTLTFGRQSTNGDGVALGDYSNAFGGNSNLNGSASKGIKFTSAEFSGVTFGADYLFGVADKKADKDYKNGYGLAVFYTGKFADSVTLKANAGYTYDKRFAPEEVSKAKVEAKDNKNISDVIKTFRKGATTAKSWLLATEVSSGPVSVGLSYGQSKLKNFSYTDTSVKIIPSVKLKTFIIGTNYNVTDNVNVYGQVQYNTIDSLKGYGYLGGVGYKLHKNVETYAEVARFKVKDGEASNNLGIGFKVSF